MPRTRETPLEKVSRVCGKQNIVEVAEELEALRAHNKLMKDAIKLAARQLCEVDLCSGTRRILLGSLKRPPIHTGTK